ncbi:MAG: hypothetical protein V4556_11175 [Bacteroidota bacterium]
MYLFSIKNNTASSDIVIIRILFALAATLSFLQIDKYGVWALIIGTALGLISFFVKHIIYRFKIPTYLFLITGVLILCIITQIIWFIFLLPLHWLLIKYLGSDTVISIDDEKVNIQKPVSSKNFTWQELDYIVLKDGLLSIGLINNHFIQAEVNTDIDEQKFNDYCVRHLPNKN